MNLKKMNCKEGFFRLALFVSIFGGAISALGSLLDARILLAPIVFATWLAGSMGIYFAINFIIVGFHNQRSIKGWIRLVLFIVLAFSAIEIFLYEGPVLGVFSFTILFWGVVGGYYGVAFVIRGFRKSQTSDTEIKSKEK